MFTKALFLLIRFLYFFIIFGFISPVFLFSNGEIIVLDSGHSPSNFGALSVSGKTEVEYNDNFTNELKQQLQSSGFKVFLTREIEEEATLKDRVRYSNDIKPVLFISIHHDSAQLQHLKQITLTNGIKTYKTKTPISGFSIFVSKNNKKFGDSFLFAKNVGKNLISLGRKPSLYHAQKIKGENKPLLDFKLGIYQYDNLYVLRKSNAPSILIELGVIVDSEDEFICSHKTYIVEVSKAIAYSVRSFLK